jgi:hypothetical protein
METYGAQRSELAAELPDVYSERSPTRVWLFVVLERGPGGSRRLNNRGEYR